MPLHLRDLLPCAVDSPLLHKPTTAATSFKNCVISPPLSPTSSTSPSNHTAAVQQLHKLQQRHSSPSNSSSSAKSYSSEATTTASTPSSQQEMLKVSSNTSTTQHQQEQEQPKMSEVATFAAGCFWGVEKAFEKHFKDENIKTAVGYIGGIDAHPTYKKVCSGLTRHAEALRIEYTPTATLNYATLVEFFFRMHDPTTLNSQGPDHGTQYRSAIFAHSPEQAEIAKRVMADVQAKHFSGQKIVTDIVWKEGSTNGAGAHAWYNAEEYHQKYLDKNPYGYECPSHFLRW